MNGLPRSSRREGGGTEGTRQGFDPSLWPRGRAFELSCCPGIMIFEYLFVPMVTQYFIEGDWNCACLLHLGIGGMMDVVKVEVYKFCFSFFLSFVLV